MREIRFRAWNKEENLMYDWGGVQYEIYAHSRDIWKDSKFELMQYTGLKDHLGREIYEGDILLTPGKFKLEVRIDNIGYGDPKFFVIGFDVCEVIGNIFEKGE